MLGLAIGGAYLAGGLARAAVAHAHIQALAAQVDGRLSENALTAAAGDASALAIARRVDGTTPSAQDLADRRLARLALQTPESPVVTAVAQAAALPQPAKVFHVASAVAQPFHMRGALDESRDLECLTQAVYYEARGESQSGQQAVAQVVLNRVRHPAFPKSVCGVVFQHAGGGCQFSFACDGSVSHHMETFAWRRAQSVAAAALDGKVAPTIGNATHFHVASLGNVWSTGMLKVAQIGSHVFYRFGGAAGAPKMFHAEPQPSAQPADKDSAASLVAGRLISASTAVVERAAAAVESITKPMKADPVPKTDVKPDGAPAKPASEAATTSAVSTSPAA